MANRDDIWSGSSSGGEDWEITGDDRNVEDELDIAGDDRNVEDVLDRVDVIDT